VSARRGILLTAAAVLAVTGCAFERTSPPAPVVLHEQAAAPSAGGTVTVAAGDTLYEIARRYNVPVRELIELNGLVPPYVLQIGQRLMLPTARYHTVQKGDTLYAVSRLYQVDLSELARANGLSEPYQIRIGQQLRLPGANGIAITGVPAPAGTPLPGRKPGATVATAIMPAIPSRQEPAPPPVTPVPVTPVPATPVPDTPAPVTPDPEVSPPAAPAVIPPRPPPRTAVAQAPVPAAARAPSRPPASPPPADDPPPRTAATFAWPVRGEILSDFGPKPGGLHNDGINIAAAAGTPVKAAESGIVAYAGNELRGFGNLLLIRHADGWMTAYAHLERMQVERGARVSRGQQIGTVGSTGNVASPQLHFEVRKGSRAVNPREWLADGTVSRSAVPGGRQGPG
jgi:murein DD-endopeptidase MepM/ murein hydrolase activator NlpD